MRIERERYVHELSDRMGNGLIKVITGLRRCGKTYLLSVLFADRLKGLGVDDAHIISVSLDDELNASLRDPLELYEYVVSRIQDGETHYIFLDEVQYAISDAELRDPTRPPRIYGVLNGLLRRQDVDVYVTGSNSRLLSTDVMTEFRGRGDELRVHPLSFAEFMGAYPKDRLSGWQEYLRYGGMPHILLRTLAARECTCSRLGRFRTKRRGLKRRRRFAPLGTASGRWSLSATRFCDGMTTRASSQSTSWISSWTPTASIGRFAGSASWEAILERCLWSRGQEYAGGRLFCHRLWER